MDGRIYSIIGVIAPIGFMLSVVLLGALTPGYSRVYRTISEVGETGVSYAREASTLFIVTGVIIVVFWYGFHRNLPKLDSQVRARL